MSTGTAYHTMDLSQKVELFDQLLLTENYEIPALWSELLLPNPSDRTYPQRSVLEK